MIEKLPIRSGGHPPGVRPPGEHADAAPALVVAAVPVGDRAMQRRHQHVAGVALVRDIDDVTGLPRRQPEQVKAVATLVLAAVGRDAGGARSQVAEQL